MKKSERMGLVLSVAEKEAVVFLAKYRGGLSQTALVRCLIHYTGGLPVCHWID
jgi:hypothetical protein